MRKVFLDMLPIKIYKGRECIDWENSIGKIVEFNYDGICGNFKILNYNKNTLKLKLRCNIYNIKYEISRDDFIRCGINNIITTILGISKVIKYKNISKHKGHKALSDGEKKYYNIPKKLINRGLKYLGYDNLSEFKYKNKILDNIKLKYNYNTVFLNYKEFFNKHDRFPVNSDYKKDKNLITKYQVLKTLSKENMSYDDLFKKISKTNYTEEEYEYNKTINKFKECCIKENKVIEIRSLQSKIGHDFRWICNRNKSVKSYKDFYTSFGFKMEKDLSKDEVIKIVYKMQSKLDRPLIYNDFRETDSFDEIGVNTIRKYFGTMNNMKTELNLIINQEDMVGKHIEDFNIIIDEIHYICDEVKRKDNRNVITFKDIVTINRLGYIGKTTFDKQAKENSTTVRKIIEDYGFKLQQEGNGLNYNYEDGEKTVSQYELNFSNKLRELGYLYNNDYYRDVKYSTIESHYEGNMNCDYKIIHNKNRIIYIEIAGILGRKCLEDNYKNNIKQESKSKELYSSKLHQKEQMLKNNNKEYYILFPSDLVDLDKLFKDKLHIDKKGFDN